MCFSCSRDSHQTFASQPKHRVHVGLVFDGQIQRALPTENFAVEGNSAVDQPGLQQYGFSLIGLSTEQCHFRISAFLGGNIFDSSDVLNFINLFDGCVCNFSCGQLLRICREDGEACPHCRVLDETAESHCLAPLPRCGVLVEDSRVGCHIHGDDCTVGSVDDT